MMGSYGGGMTGFVWIGMGLFWLALLGFIVWLVIRLLPGKSHGPTTAANSPVPRVATPVAPAAAPALAILDERLASGEIDVETYRTIRAALLEGREGER
ncbi:SHOCT domain-containing protein [Demequina lutea]|uniref:Putative membrane protein n=1 Tax=Demequina lutea TaxID=431489 RepID=A0A7Y9Z9M7_9MICO|nr:SHOCT domain-containing protein [Demequina lutea]NYI41314.1 putative membrane protein [Demequina lutea]